VRLTVWPDGGVDGDGAGYASATKSTPVISKRAPPSVLSVALTAHPWTSAHQPEPRAPGRGGGAVGEDRLPVGRRDPRAVVLDGETLSALEFADRDRESVAAGRVRPLVRQLPRSGVVSRGATGRRLASDGVARPGPGLRSTVLDGVS